MNIAVIPARGGSKRIPRKNIRRFCGKPMIAWSIETALQSKCFDMVIVSTDDSEIAAVAERYGASVPFLRPAELADDHTATRPVVNHAIEEIAKRCERPEYVCCIYATAPFLASNDLIEAFRMLREESVDFVFSCGKFAYPVQRGFYLNNGVEPTRIHPEHRWTRSQDLQAAYHDAGQFYWGRVDSFLSGKDAIAPHSRPWVMPHQKVHDIDSEDDWKRAELFFNALGQERRHES